MKFQDTKSAAEFYEAKISELAANIKDLEGIVQSKTNSLRVVEEGASFYHPLFSAVVDNALVLRQKVLAAGGAQQQPQAA